MQVSQQCRTGSPGFGCDEHIALIAEERGEDHPRIEHMVDQQALVPRFELDSGPAKSSQLHVIASFGWSGARDLSVRPCAKVFRVPRRSRAAAALTKASVLDRATALGSVEGLEGLTIGRLAAEIGLSKSGVIGHFGSKEQLQLATVEAGLTRFREEVWEPVASCERGLTRLGRLMEAWLSYLERDVFPGGCFLTAASLEFDDRPGAVRAAIAAAWRQWLDLIEHEAAEAQARGELATALSPRQIAFQLHAYVSEANWARQLLRTPDAVDASRVAIEQLLAPRAAIDEQDHAQTPA